MAPTSRKAPRELLRETFASRLGVLATMIGVAVGLGNVWRFPYMVGKFGGAAFVLVYVAAVALLGVPALMAEWALGRHTRRGPVGAFHEAGLPFGRAVGWFFFCVMAAAAAYYTNAIGWVLYYGVGEAVQGLGAGWAEGAVLPPEEGFDPRSFLLQVLCTVAVLASATFVVARGLREGIERASRRLLPMLLVILLLLVVRALTLPGAGAGVSWFLEVDLAAITPGVAVAALGQAFFSLSLGGTFMVVYGSYLDEAERLPRSAVLTAAGDLVAGLLAGLAILPAVFALGLEPAAGPGLIFATLPGVFDQIPLGRLWGFLFFGGLFAAAFLSSIAALEVMVAGITDNTRFTRRPTAWGVAALVFGLSLVPMINLRIFVPWDLIFGSGMQTLGALLTVVTLVWWVDRSEALRQLGGERPEIRLLHLWLRFAVPGAILLVFGWWVVTEVLGMAP